MVISNNADINVQYPLKIWPLEILKRTVFLWKKCHVENARRLTGQCKRIKSFFLGPCGAMSSLTVGSWQSWFFWLCLWLQFGTVCCVEPRLRQSAKSVKVSCILASEYSGVPWWIFDTCHLLLNWLCYTTVCPWESLHQGFNPSHVNDTYHVLQLLFSLHKCYLRTKSFVFNTVISIMPFYKSRNKVTQAIAFYLLLPGS